MTNVSIEGSVQTGYVVWLDGSLNLATPSGPEAIYRAAALLGMESDFSGEIWQPPVNLVEAKPKPKWDEGEPPRGYPTAMALFMMTDDEFLTAYHSMPASERRDRVASVETMPVHGTVGAALLKRIARLAGSRLDTIPGAAQQPPGRYRDVFDGVQDAPVASVEAEPEAEIEGYGKAIDNAEAYADAEDLFATTDKARDYHGMTGSRRMPEGER